MRLQEVESICLIIVELENLNTSQIDLPVARFILYKAEQTCAREAFREVQPLKSRPECIKSWGLR